MKIVYISSLYGDNAKKIYNANFTGQQVQIFNKLIVDGLSANNLEVHCKSSLPLSSNITQKRIIKVKNDNNISYFPTINFPIIKDIFYFVISFFYALYTSLVSNNNVFVCDVLSVSNSLGVSLACKIINKDCVAIVTDIPEFVTKSNVFNKLVHTTINICSKYIFLTEEMNNLLNKSKKPYIIIDGMCTPLPHVSFDQRNMNIIYAGTIDEDNGIDKLVDAFLKTESKYELHLYGQGSYVNELKKISKESNNIKFFGVVPHSLILEEIQKASFLINPRSTKKEFIKYSFPSKTLEYLSSGTPFISTKLPCYSSEYNNYLNYIDDSSVENMARDLYHYLNCENYSSLLQKAQNGKFFAINFKNNKNQTEKIIQLIKE